MTLGGTAPSAPNALRTAALTAIAMTAFAANSVLNRQALAPDLIDPATFTTVRLLSGAVTLAAILALRGGGFAPQETDWRAVLALFAYAVFFSFAYVSLTAATGALILFGLVQLTMFSAALSTGERFGALSWLGFAAAFGGLAFLVSPGLAAPDPIGAALMALAGVAWGVYSLRGRGVADPLAATTRNFVFAAPLGLTCSALFLADAHASAAGLALAITSGAIASGCGYVVWFAALRGLTATRAATVQLSAPIIAALGGVALLSEPLTWRLALASMATLGGVALVLAQRDAAPANKHTEG